MVRYTGCLRVPGWDAVRLEATSRSCPLFGRTAPSRNSSATPGSTAALALVSDNVFLILTN